MNRLFFVVALIGFGCGGDDTASPREACEDASRVTCSKLYECLTESERMAAMLPATEAECVTSYNTMFDCASQTAETACDAGETYHADKASQCVDQIDGLSCETVRTGDIDAAAPACNEVCTM